MPLFSAAATGTPPEEIGPGKAIRAHQSVGKSLRRIFGQDDSLAKVEEQHAARSQLMNPARLAIFVHLCRNPCDHQRAVSRALGINGTVAAWHLHALTDGGMLASIDDSGKTLYWISGSVMPEDAALIGMMRRELDTVKAVIEMGGDSSQAEVAKLCGCGRQTAGARLSRLIGAEAISKTGTGPGARYSVSEHALRTADDYREASRDASQRLLTMLEADGLMPKAPSFKNSVLRVSVSLPTGRKRLSLACNPMSFLERLLRKA